VSHAEFVELVLGDNVTGGRPPQPHQAFETPEWTPTRTSRTGIRPSGSPATAAWPMSSLNELRRHEL
jgi:hypothetical protein